MYGLNLGCIVCVDAIREGQKVQASDFVTRFFCNDCGETYAEQPEKCDKCNSNSFEEIQLRIKPDNSVVS